jgi:putative transposase
MYVHATYAVTPDREPLDVVNAWMWVRELRDAGARAVYVGVVADCTANAAGQNLPGTGRLAVLRRRRGNLFMYCRYNTNAQQKREARDQAFEAWDRVTCVPMLGRLAA